MVENVATAEKTIGQLLNNYRKIPAVIVFNFSSDYEESFAQWKTYLESHRVLRSIPFFLYSEHVTDALRELHKQYPFIDEIISRDCFANLDNKVNFVAKFKRLQLFRPAAAAPRVPRSFSAIVSNTLKRAFDILVSATLILLLSPLLLLIALLIRIESKGPVIYRAPRAGSNYRIFKFYKFRTMIADADKKLHQLNHLNQYDTNSKGPKFYKVSNDPRITRLGNFLRNTSIDEIPQLFNVLKGEMSLVGNRPLPLYEAATLTTDEWAERFMAPAGITGLWQVSKRGKKEMSVEERIELDIRYARKNSFVYDMWLMASTPKALIQKDNV
ncbi:sugar transferase [Chitinophaga sp. Mgbs1]|uniref:Sugar transferase n=1 Tax=Chitinophaga solisilvae TaxID=1233460 RepID=A0A9Q5GVK4_9BACT|nr:sugar transferase [Chitinophaga solisilvae]